LHRKISRTQPALFVGITAWNSERFIGPCIEAIRRTCDDLNPRIVVLDNASQDDTADVAHFHRVEVVVRPCNQAEALNLLLRRSQSPRTLLIHSDVILLSPAWFAVCNAHLSGPVALVSPEDVGCGPFTRPWGVGMPESSFLFFDTAKALKARQWFRRQRFKIRWPYRALDFFGPHVTYNLPAVLMRQSFDWTMMNVHPSPTQDEPLYVPAFKPKYWSDSWQCLRYGLGNFYSLDGQITHYHNWFDRVLADIGSIDELSQATFPREGGLPVAYVEAYTARFLADWRAGTLQLPSV